MIYAGHFEGLHPRSHLNCMRCMQRLQREDRIRAVFIVGGVVPSPKGGGKILVLAAADNNAIFNEHVHVDCADRGIRNVALVEPPPKKYAPLMSPTNLREIPPRGDSFKCVRCLKDFEREDRVFSMHIVLGTGFSAEAGTNVTACSGNYEMTHVDCHDPRLSGNSTILFTQ